MGNESSTGNSKEFRAKFQSQYTKLKESKDKSFGQVTIYRQNKNHLKMILVKDVVIHDPNQLKNLTKQSDKRSSLKNPGLIDLMGYSVDHQANLCSESNRISYYVEYIENSLEDDIDSRFANKQYYRESVIWKWLLQIVEANLDLKENGIYGGDIRPQLFKINETGDLKLNDCNIVPPVMNAYKKYLQDNEKVYLAPETLNFAKQRNVSPSYDIQKADIFALGIMLLQMCSLSITGHYYDYTKISTIQNHIDDDLKTISMFYQPFLVRLIQSCICMNPEERPSFEDLYAILAPFIDQIQREQAFAPSRKMYDENQMASIVVQQPKLQSSVLVNGTDNSSSSQVQVPLKAAPLVSNTASNYLQPINVPQNPIAQKPIQPQEALKQSYAPQYQVPNSPYQPQQSQYYPVQPQPVYQSQAPGIPQYQQSYNPYQQQQPQQRQYINNQQLISQYQQPKFNEFQSNELDQKVQAALQNSEQLLARSQNIYRQ